MIEQQTVEVKSAHKKRPMENLEVSVPGRICLFGEHQDYLKLPVITAAIDLRVRISGSVDPGRHIRLRLPDIHEEKKMTLPDHGEMMVYEEERDYYRSVINVLNRHGVELKNGCDCTVKGNIPINSGTSSSSALNVAWCRFLLAIHPSEAADKLKPPEEVARMAYLAEVEEFGEPGGMMDHYATALGGILYQQFANEVEILRLPGKLGTFVLGDSREPKDTKGILKRVKKGVLEAVSTIRKYDPEFDLSLVPVDEAERYNNLLKPDQIDVLEGAIQNRDITQQALKILQAEQISHELVGQLLSRHHAILRDRLQISTPKIDRMISAALEAGALGGKINGSGGGGCMFAYAPVKPEKVAAAIERESGKAFIVHVDKGMSLA